MIQTNIDIIAKGVVSGGSKFFLAEQHSHRLHVFDADTFKMIDLIELPGSEKSGHFSVEGLGFHAERMVNYPLIKNHWLSWKLIRNPDILCVKVF
ncbi:MAG: hypothetical protein A2161_16365 [Candidatus Schekmanbacteria bacterium RBG_13_48_7]|uniref:Uncharacterized protein n=1 Tax=Candidatus Schekmanbacteria bacterium RBG_13_48_7 TaxID=1817878 RepID=A0A1F7S491_9BACT|nr:MAG: hypothetical protein A2161_16365 [Candidatus Schekmanbacteria bacterium RBG_13_48_7]